MADAKPAVMPTASATKKVQLLAVLMHSKIGVFSPPHEVRIEAYARVARSAIVSSRPRLPAYTISISAAHLGEGVSLLYRMTEPWTPASSEERTSVRRSGSSLAVDEGR